MLEPVQYGMEQTKFNLLWQDADNNHMTVDRVVATNSEIMISSHVRYDIYGTESWDKLDRNGYILQVSRKNIQQKNSTCRTYLSIMMEYCAMNKLVSVHMYMPILFSKQTITEEIQTRFTRYFHCVSHEHYISRQLVST